MNIRTIEVDVVQAELTQALVELLLDVLRSVIVIPELGRDEKLLTLYDGGDHALQSGTDLLLVLVNQGTVDVPVAMADGNLDLNECS